MCRSHATIDGRFDDLGELTSEKDRMTRQRYHQPDAALSPGCSLSLTIRSLDVNTGQRVEYIPQLWVDENCDARRSQGA
jgi:hypothetical protein